MNASWHRKHPMPKRPTLEPRVRWQAAQPGAMIRPLYAVRVTFR